MTNKNFSPSKKHLTITWFILMTLTVVSMVSGQATGDMAAGLSILSVTVLLLVTFFKAVQVLRVYLGLETSTAGWKALFYVMVGGILVFILLAFLVSGSNLL